IHAPQPAIGSIRQSARFGRRGARQHNGSRLDLLTMETAAAPTPPSAEAEVFYADALRGLSKFGVPYLIAGTYAVSAYTGITRPTKDLDIFCKPGDSFRILERFKHLGYTADMECERW